MAVSLKHLQRSNKRSGVQWVRQGKDIQLDQVSTHLKLQSVIVAAK